MSQDGYIRKGSLLKCPQKALNPFKQKWQNRWFVLYGNSEHGRVRLEYYDSEKTWQQEKSKRVIPLSNCVSIKPVWNKEYNHVIEIVIQDKTLHLAANSKEEEKAWFKDLCKIVFGNSNRNSIVQMMDKPPSELPDFGYHTLDRKTVIDGSVVPNSPHMLHSVPEILHESDSGSHEDVRSIAASSVSGGINDDTSVSAVHGSHDKIQKITSVGSELSSLVSFESGFDDASSMASTITEGSTYPVTIRPTIASQKAGMSGTYLLQVTSMNLFLVDIPSQNAVCEWPIQFLRRYGRGRTKFSFEASEKCKHGKGVYTFNTLEGDSIFHLVDLHARGISARNQLLRKRTSMPEGFKPIGFVSKKLHHSEGKLIDKFTDISAHARTRFGESTNDILVLNPSDSISQSGTLQRAGTDKNKSGQPRGLSIGSGISLEIAQNIMPQSNDGKVSPVIRRSAEVLDGTYDEERKSDVIVEEEEEHLAQMLQSESPTIIGGLETVCEKSENELMCKLRDDNKKKNIVKRSNSLKLSVSLKRNNSNKEIKKSNSVKRSSSFRNRFFKSKSTDDDKYAKAVDKKVVSRSEHDLAASQPVDNPSPSPSNADIETNIAKHMKVKDILAKAIEDDMTRSWENEKDNTSIEQGKNKKRKFLVRHKSNEMLGNGCPEKPRSTGLSSSSFAGYDYKGHAVLCQSNSSEKENDAEEVKRLQRRTQSVMKKVELYEEIKKQADEHRVTSYTFWRRKTNSKE